MMDFRPIATVTFMPAARSGFAGNSARQFDVTGDDPVDAPTVAEEEPARVVQAKTLAAHRSFVGRNDRDPVSDQGMMRIVFAEQCGEGGFGAADQRGVEMAREGDEDFG
jgi:hypothetical protein